MPSPTLAPETRVTMVGRYFNRQGGVSRWLAECADRGAIDFNTTVITHKIEDVGACTAPFLTVPMMTHPRWAQLPSFGAFARRRVPADADLVHVHNPQMTGGDVYTAHSCNTAHIAERRQHAGMLPATVSRFWLPHLSGNVCERRAYTPQAGARLPVVAAVSRQVAKELHDYLGIPEENLAVTNPGVDVRQFRPVERRRAQTDGHTFVPDLDLVFVGYEFERKGLATAIEAIARLRPLRTRLRVLGSDDPAPYARRARTLGIDHAVEFLGHVGTPERVIAEADGLLLPSVYEAFPLVVMEALACGTPVIASRASNAGEIVKDGVTGMLFEPASNVDALATTLTRFLAARTAWDEMRAAARRTAEGRTWDRAWQETIEVYAEALARKQVRQAAAL